MCFTHIIYTLPLDILVHIIYCTVSTDELTLVCLQYDITFQPTNEHTLFTIIYLVTCHAGILVGRYVACWIQY